MEIRVLGPLEVLANGQPVNLGGPKQRAVLAVLAARAGKRLSVDFLLEEVYGDAASPAAKRSIQTYVSNLRRVVGDAIGSDRRGYLLAVPSGSIDAVRFELLRSEATQLIGSDPIGAAELLREALGLWRGHPYADIDARGLLATESARLSQARIDALEVRIEADLAAGRHLELISELEALTREHPLRERFRAQHMLALYRAGRQADALRSYSWTRTLLVDELGIEPSSELQTLEMRILDQDPSLAIAVTSVIERVAVLAAEHTIMGATASEREAAAAWRDEVIAAAVLVNGGEVVDVRRNTVYARFPSAPQALQAAARLPLEQFRVAVDFGAVDNADDSVSGPPVSRALRLAAIAHPGQVLVSDAAQRALAEAGARGWTLQMLGRFEIRGIADGVQLFQLAGPDHPERPSLLLDRLPPPLREPTADFIAGYELRELLGEGTTGQVHRAYQASVGREVAVRVIRPDVVGDLRFIRRFESEIQRILDLSHPSIVPVIDFWRDPTAAFVISRLAEHPSLTQVDPEVAHDEALDLVVRIAATLDYGHASGFVHGRIRPHNILIDESGVPHILDFGLAPLFADLVPHPADAYTAPEAIDGSPTVAGDVYSLAVLAAEMLSGRRVPLDGALPTTGTHADEAIARATRLEPTERHPDLASFVAELLEQTPAASPLLRREIRNPFKGLTSFTEADAGDFHGRDALSERLIEAVGGSRLTVIVGSSGIGKSSVVHAGVVPGLRGAENQLVATMTPGHHPFDALAEALERVAVAQPGEHIAEVAGMRASLADAASAVLPSGSELVLVVDQLEELFTLTSEHERKAFLGMIAENVSPPQSPVTVIATMRADFYDRPLDHPRFGELVANNTVPVHAPTSQEWRDLIALPAENLGVAVDDTLVAAIIEDVESEPGALPLVQHALTQMFNGRTQDRLTLDTYRQAGGLAGWIGRTAERLYRGLSATEQEVARDVFVRLVAVNEETEDTRRRVRQSELDHAGLDWSTVQSVMEEFIAHRLVVGGRDPGTRQPTIEVAHEALIHRWDRLADWIDERREDLLIGRRIELAAADWLAADRAEEFLYRGGRLERAEQWAGSDPAMAGSEPAEFLSASRRVVDGKAQAARRNRRRVLAVLSGALVVSLALGGVAWIQRGVAERRAAETRVRELTTEARLAVEDDPELAMLLALEAHDVVAGLDSRFQGVVAAALQETTQASRLVGVIPHGRAFVEASPDGRLLVVDAGDGSDDVVVYDQTTTEEIARFDPGFAPRTGTFSPDGSLLALTTAGPDDAVELSGTGDYAVKLIATADYSEVAVLGSQCCAIRPRFNSDGSWIGADDPGGGFIAWSLVDGTEQRGPGAWGSTTRWMPGSSTLLQVSRDGAGLIERDIVTGETASIETPSIDGVEWIDVHRAARSVVAVGSEVRYWRLDDVDDGWTIDEAGIFEAEFSPDGSMVALYGGSEQVLLVSTETGDTMSLRGHAGGVGNIAFGATGERIFVREEASGVKIWDLGLRGRPALQNLIVGGVPDRNDMWLSPDGQRLAVVEAHGDFEQVVIHDLATGGLARSMEFDGRGPVSSPSGRFVGGEVPGTKGVVQDVEKAEIVYTAECRAPIAISDDARFAALMDLCADDTVVKLTDLATGDELREWISPAAAIGPSSTPSEGLVAYSPVPFDELHVVSLDTGELGTFLHDDDARFPQFSPDGRYLSFGTIRGGGWVIDVKLFRDGATLEEAVVLHALVEGGTTRTAVAGGDMAATTHSGELVRLWDIATGAEWATIPIAMNDQSQASFTADGRYLYYQARPGVVARMPLDLDELAALARSSVFRDFTEAECERYEINDHCSVSATALTRFPDAFTQQRLQPAARSIGRSGYATWTVAR